jgi:hypothetical protein
MMEFTKVKTREKVPVFLARRSLVLLSGEARYEWRHGIPARKNDVCDGNTIPRDRRLSLTFRNVLLTGSEGGTRQVSSNDDGKRGPITAKRIATHRKTS